VVGQQLRFAHHCDQDLYVANERVAWVVVSAPLVQLLLLFYQLHHGRSWLGEFSVAQQTWQMPGTAIVTSPYAGSADQKSWAM
jgi:hypothetical protein